MPVKGVRCRKFGKIDITREYCERFPKSGHSALGRKIFSETNGLFPTLDAAIQSVRVVRGKKGANMRTRAVRKDLYETDKRSCSPLWNGLPEGRKQLPDFKIWQFNTPGWWLVMGDLHIPWHDLECISALIDEAKRRKVVGILLNGDICDCHDISEHEKDPRVRVFKDEIETVRAFLASLRSDFPEAEIVWKLGNHEDRFLRFMLRHAPQLLGVDCFEWTSICKTEEQNVTVIGDCQPIMLGALATIHGHEYRFAISNPVSASRGLFLRAGVTALCNHYHRTSQFSKSDLLKHLVSTWSVGCACDLTPRWLPNNDWNHGGAFVHIDDEQAFEIDNLRYYKGKLRH